MKAAGQLLDDCDSPGESIRSAGADAPSISRREQGLLKAYGTGRHDLQRFVLHAILTAGIIVFNCSTGGPCYSCGTGTDGALPGAEFEKEVNMWLLRALFIGFIIGVVAKFLMPVNDPGGFIVTTLIGIAGSIIATFIGRQLGRYLYGEPSGFIASVVGAMLPLLGYRMISKGA